MAVVIGKIDSFDDNVEDWATYIERVEQFFITNNIVDEKKVPALLSLIGAKMYSLLSSLTAPAKPSTKSFDEIVATLQRHLSPKPLVIAERFRFHKRDQREGESIDAFIVEIRKLSEHCEFGETLDATLRDRLVCGLKQEAIQKRLLTENDELTFKRAVEIATAMETATKDAMELQNVRKSIGMDAHKVVSVADEIKAAALSSNAAALSSRPTTLQDLPIEVLDNILMKVLVKKVMDKKLAKSAWFEYASRLIKSLRTVWSRWDHSLTTNWFEIVLRRKLNNFEDPTAVSVELMTTSECDSCSWGFARLNNRIYCIDTYPPGKQSQDCDDSVLYVFEGQDTKHRIKEIVLSSMKDLSGLATCTLSGSIYLWQSFVTACPSCPAVWHLVPDGVGSFEVLRWPNYAPSGDFLGCSTISKIDAKNLSVIEGGNVVALRQVFYEDSQSDNILSVHKPDGLVIRNLRLSHGAEISNVAMKSNGNFVYAQVIDDNGACIIREVDQDGKEIRKFHWEHFCFCYSKNLFLDSCERVIFHNCCNDLLFLDCELNLLGEAEPIEDDVAVEGFQADFDKETNEMVVMYWVGDVFFLKLTMEVGVEEDM